MKKILSLILMVAVFAGCATTTRYFSYTQTKYPPKSGHDPVAIFTGAPKLPASRPYAVIGKVDIQGYASDGVSPETLMGQAQTAARKKGADAIINAISQTVPYAGAYVIPGHFGRYRYHPARYIPYQNALLEFSGDLVVFTSS